MKEWLPFLSFLTVVGIQLLAAARWVGRQQEAREADAKVRDGQQSEITLLRQHATGLDRWIGKVDELLQAHDEEIDLLRKSGHDIREGVAVNSEQILSLRRDMDEMRSNLRQLDEKRRPH